MISRSRFKNVNEAGDMIASAPGPALAGPSPLELVARELDKLHNSGEVNPLIYSRARDLLALLRTPLLNIYRSSDRDLRPVLAFLLRKAAG
jgi:hypothetical protein